jgi:hypothetical protein
MRERHSHGRMTRKFEITQISWEEVDMHIRGVRSIYNSFLYMKLLPTKPASSSD